jgi:hypothetical protein
MRSAQEVSAWRLDRSRVGSFETPEALFLLRASEPVLRLLPFAEANLIRSFFQPKGEKGKT